MFTIILFHMALLNLWHGASNKKVPLNMLKMCGFTPRGKRRLRNVASTLCARRDIFQLPCMQSHPGLWSRFIHFAVSNESVSRQWRPWSGCASTQSDQGLHCPRPTHFRMAWQIYGWFFKLFSLISWFLNIVHCVVFIYFMLLKERETLLRWNDYLIVE